MKHFFIITGFLVLTACGGSSDSASVSGVNLSGSYFGPQIICIDANNASIITKTGYLNSFSNEITISGNSYISEISDADCTVRITAKIVFNSDNTYDTSNAEIVSATGGSCTISFAATESGSGGPLNVNPLNITYIEGGISDASNVYGTSATELAIFVNGLTTVGSAPADLCFLNYLKR